MKASALYHKQLRNYTSRNPIFRLINEIGARVIQSRGFARVQKWNFGGTHDVNGIVLFSLISSFW